MDEKMTIDTLDLIEEIIDVRIIGRSLPDLLRHVTIPSDNHGDLAIAIRNFEDDLKEIKQLIADFKSLNRLEDWAHCISCRCQPNQERQPDKTD
jgi:hypothetical protein